MMSLDESVYSPPFVLCRKRPEAETIADGDTVAVDPPALTSYLVPAILINKQNYNIGNILKGFLHPGLSPKAKPPSWNAAGKCKLSLSQN